MKRGHTVHFDDLKGNERWSTGSQAITQEQIIDFASVWDPQTFHVDVDEARSSTFGGLVASGLHTLLVTYRLFNELGILKDSAIAGLGYQQIRFEAPVRPGDLLRVDVWIHSLRATGSGDRGIVTFALDTSNQDGKTVLTAALAVLAAKSTVKVTTDLLPTRRGG
jgi:acyl dehydratase